MLSTKGLSSLKRDGNATETRRADGCGGATTRAGCAADSGQPVKARAAILMSSSVLIFLAMVCARLAKAARLRYFLVDLDAVAAAVQDHDAVLFIHLHRDGLPEPLLHL